MAKSRQAESLRRKSLTTLRGAAAATPLTVEDGGTAWIVRAGTDEVMRGRYEVVSAYLAGFVDAFDTNFDRLLRACDFALKTTPPSGRPVAENTVACVVRRYQTKA